MLIYLALWTWYNFDSRICSIYILYHNWHTFINSSNIVNQCWIYTLNLYNWMTLSLINPDVLSFTVIASHSETEYHLDVYCATNGAHIETYRAHKELLWGPVLQNVYSFQHPLHLKMTNVLLYYHLRSNTLCERETIGVFPDSKRGTSTFTMRYAGVTSLLESQFLECSCVNRIYIGIQNP
jgi:hypothetical protein